MPPRWPLKLFAAVTMTVLLALAPGHGGAADGPPRWTVDPAESRIVFVGRQMRVPTEGEFRRFTAAVRFSADDPANSSAEIVIETASATTGNSMIDRELAGPKWFASEQFSTAKFVAGNFRSAGGDRYEAVGTLTLRDVTETLVFPFTLKIEDGAEPGVLVARAVGQAEISRLKFGVGRGEWGDTSIVADEVVIRIELLGRRAK